MWPLLMAHLAEPPSSSISFASSSLLSNGSSAIPALPPPPSPTAESASATLEIVCLGKLSANLERLLTDTTEFDLTDADVVVSGDGGKPIGVHRCILAARSRFFLDLFTRGGSVAAAAARPRYSMEELVPEGQVGREAFMAFLSYLYTGKLRPPAPETVTCVDHLCAHDACRPAVNFAVELMYASYVFQIPELVSVLQRRLLSFVDKVHVEDVIPILVVAFRSKLTQLLGHCMQRIARSDFGSAFLEKELPHEVADEIRAIRNKSLLLNEPASSLPADSVLEKRIKRIHKALDSDDVELVKLLLSESQVSLDDAFALHYAAAYCDPKVACEILELGSASVNLKNDRGYTPLHVAAFRREPTVIVSLLNKGASALATTPDGQTASSICRRLTRAIDYYAKAEKGQETNKDRICIDILEREVRRNPSSTDESVTSPLLADDLQMKLLYLEKRVALAKKFFPAEARLAMKMAHAETTSEFGGLPVSRSSGNLMDVDLNVTPLVQNKRILMRVDALTKTVEQGRRYFPHCSEVLDKFLEENQPDLMFVLKATPDEQKSKRTRLGELEDNVQKAFSKDKAESRVSALSSSSSSLSFQRGETTRQRAWK